MQRIDFIFVNTERNLEQKIVGAIITGAEHGEDFTSHVAIRFPQLEEYGPKIVEALANGVVLSDYDKYTIDHKIGYITIEVEDDEYDAMVKCAIDIIKHKYSYGWKSVILGFVADNISRRLARLLAKLLRADTDDNMDCSETGTKILRVKIKDFCKNESGATITPEFFFKRLMMAGYEKKINIVATQFSSED